MFLELHKSIASKRPLTTSYISSMVNSGDFNIGSLPPKRASYILIEEPDIDNYFRALLKYYELDIELDFIKSVYRRTLILEKGENSPEISAELAIRNNDVIAFEYLVNNYNLSNLEWVIDMVADSWREYDVFKRSKMLEILGSKSKPDVEPRFKLKTVKDVEDYLSRNNEISPATIRDMIDNDITFPALDRALTSLKVNRILLRPGALKYEHLFDRHNIEIINRDYLKLMDIEIVNSITYNKLTNDFIRLVRLVVETDSDDDDLMELILDFGDWITAALIISHVYKLVML